MSANRWAPAKTMEEERALAMAQVRAALNERLRSGKSELGHARKYAAQIRQWRRKRQRQPLHFRSSWLQLPAHRFCAPRKPRPSQADP